MSNEQVSIAHYNGDERDQFIPVRKSAVLKALLEHAVMQGGEARKKFAQLCRLLGAIFHYEYFEWLEKLRDDYYHFNPDISADHRLDPQSVETARAELLETLDRVLKGANYKELPLDEIEKAHADRPVLRVKVETTMENYHQVKFFRRGHHKELVDVRKWFGLRKHLIETWVFDNVILMVTIKLPSEIKSKRQLKNLERSQLRPGSILIKYQAGRMFDVEQRQAEVDQLRAQLAGAKWNLDKTVVRAPADGYVTNITLRKGARVASLPLTPVMAFIDTSDTIMGTEIAQINSRYIRPGQSAEITFKFLPGHVYRARVEAVLQAVSTG